MKIFVDELPMFPDKCPFGNYDYDVHRYLCKLSECESLICVNTDDCPYLKVLEEKDD